MKRQKKTRTVWLALTVLAMIILLGTRVNADFIYGEMTKVPNINSAAMDDGAQISRDGLELYFYSKREHTEGECYTNIWVSKRLTINDPWSEPVKLEAPVNSAGPEFTPSISADGLELYFADGLKTFYSWSGCMPNPEGYGNSDIWVSTRAGKDESWGVPKNLGPMINTKNDETDPCISADGLELYFASNLSNDPQNSEIMMATRPSQNDPWGEPVNLGTNVNSGQYESTPFISPSGLTLFFSRGYSKSHIHVSRRATAMDPWGPSEFFAPVNSASEFDVWNQSPGGAEYYMSFASGGSTLYFSHGSSAFDPNYDIWQVEVSPMVDFNGDAAVDVLDALELLEHWEATDSPLYDIAPAPFGDGIVDARDLRVLADHMIENPYDPGQPIDAEAITATASSSDSADQGPKKTIDGSGLNDLGQHSIESTDMWLSAGTEPQWIQYEFDENYELHEMHVWNSNQLIEPFLGLGAKDVLIETSVDGIEWTTLEGTTQFNQATGNSDYTANTVVDFGGVSAKFVRINILSGYGTWSQWGLSEVRFF